MQKCRKVLSAFVSTISHFDAELDKKNNSRKMHSVDVIFFLLHSLSSVLSEKMEAFQLKMEKFVSIRLLKLKPPMDIGALFNLFLHGKDSLISDTNEFRCRWFFYLQKIQSEIQ